MKNIYRVKIGHDIAVVAKDEHEAEQYARWEFRKRNLESEPAHVTVAPLSEGMPGGWDDSCVPYGDVPDDTTIRWLLDEAARTRTVTFSVTGNLDVIDRVREALKEFQVKEEEKQNA